MHCKLYRGYANDRTLVLEGHVFGKRSPAGIRLDRRPLRHALNMLRLFTVQTVEGADLTMSWAGETAQTHSEADGYFRFELDHGRDPVPGWHPVDVTVRHRGKTVSALGEFQWPEPGGMILVSDIDDTFLISHSASTWRKLFLILGSNVGKRKAVPGTVEHYRALRDAGRTNGQNAQFFVSSSEWNLYNLIDQFSELQGLPKAVYKLRKIKSSLRDFLGTGGGDHDHKASKIDNLLAFYPHRPFVLLGDDAQRDPELYAELVEQHPGRIKAVYLRAIKGEPSPAARAAQKRIEAQGTACCCCRNGTEALAHSREIGLLDPPEQ